MHIDIVFIVVNFRMIQRSKELCRRLAKLQMKETAYFAHDSLGNFVRQTSGRMSHLQAGLSLLSLGFDEKLVKKLAILQENGSLPANGFLRSDLAQMSPEGLVKVLQRYKRSGRKIPPDLMPKLNTAHKQHFTPDGVNSEQLMREIDFVKDLLDETKRGRDWDSDATDTDDSDSEDMLASIRRTATKLGGGEQRFPTNEKSATVM